jgi:two-component system cell cycle sensor histidine kinase/response regulator CckA
MTMAYKMTVPTILVVDDHEAVLRGLYNYLKRQGYNVLQARDGEAALSIAASHPGVIHLLITDLVMARVNGRELVRRLLPSRPEMQVIMMSGFPEEVMAQEGTSPAVATLRKPFQPRQLLELVERALTVPPLEGTRGRALHAKL